MLANSLDQNFIRSFPKQIYSSVNKGNTVWGIVESSQKFRLVPQIILMEIENIDRPDPAAKIPLQDTSIDIIISKKKKKISNFFKMNPELKKNKNFRKSSSQSKNNLFFEDVDDNDLKKSGQEKSNVFETGDTPPPSDSFNTNNMSTLYFHKHHPNFLVNKSPMEALLSNKFMSNHDINEMGESKLKDSKMNSIQNSLVPFSLKSDAHRMSEINNAHEIVGFYFNKHLEFGSEKEYHGDSSCFFFKLHRLNIEIFRPVGARKKYFRVSSQGIFLGTGFVHKARVSSLQINYLNDSVKLTIINKRGWRRVV